MRHGKYGQARPSAAFYPLLSPLSTPLSPLLSTHSLNRTRPFLSPRRIAARVDEQAAATTTHADHRICFLSRRCVLCAVRPSGTDARRFLEHARVMDPVPFRSGPRRRSSLAMWQMDPKRGGQICNATAPAKKPERWSIGVGGAERRRAARGAACSGGLRPRRGHRRAREATPAPVQGKDGRQGCLGRLRDAAPGEDSRRAAVIGATTRRAPARNCGQGRMRRRPRHLHRLSNGYVARIQHS